MLFRELTFQDFLVFRGENTLTFPTVDGKPSLVLVLAPNNGGKTNVIRALHFLLYGDLLGHDGHAHRLINDAARQAVGRGCAEAWVQATIAGPSDGKPLTFRRRVEAQLENPGRSVSTQVILERAVPFGNQIRFEPDEGVLQRRLEQMVPRQLFDYFYFQGEELARQLIDHGQGNRIREGLAMLLHESEWRHAASTVEDVRRELDRQLDKVGGLSDAEKRLRGDCAAVEATLAQVQDTIDKGRQDLGAAETAYEAAAAKILALSRDTPAHATVQNLQACRRKFQRALGDIERADRIISDAVSGSRGLPFLGSAIARAQPHLERLRAEEAKRVQLAQDVVERLLARGTCACGRALDPERDADACATLRACTRSADSGGVAADLRSLGQCLADGTPQSFLERIAITRREVRSALQEREEAIREHDRLAAEEKALEDTVRQSNEAEIRKQQEIQRQANTDRANLQLQLREREQKAVALRSRRSEILRAIRDAEARGGSKEYSRLADAARRAEELQELIEQSLARLKESFHQVLQQSVARHYDPIVTDGTRAYVDKATLLPAVVIHGVPQRNIGGGQRQMLVLAHIVSLAELRRQLTEDLRELGIVMGLPGDQSFFLDSVFAPADDVYAGEIARFIPGKARQMLLLLASQQWHQAVRQGIEPHVDKAYRFVLHTPNPKRAETEYTTKFRGRAVSLLKRISKDDAPYTVIREVKR